MRVGLPSGHRLCPISAVAGHYVFWYYAKIDGKWVQNKLTRVKIDGSFLARVNAGAPTVGPYLEPIKRNIDPSKLVPPNTSVSKKPLSAKHFKVPGK
ncbi:hypothetical protein N9112_00320 [bacterium]|nr:hypothetical protein [bacterium]